MLDLDDRLLVFVFVCFVCEIRSREYVLVCVFPRVIVIVVRGLCEFVVCSLMRSSALATVNLKTVTLFIPKNIP